MTKRGWLLLPVVAPLLIAQDLKEFEKKVTEFTLSNGLHFIVAERHEAPVVSFHTYVDAGSVDDPLEQAGIAHMFEHMAFKGTETIGTRNWPAEKKALEEIEQVYDRLEQEQNKGPRADQSKIGLLKAELSVAISKANAHVIPNAYPRIIEENGGTGMNAQTGLDATEYYYGLPSNRLELWFLMESQRFLKPVFREFYKERDVVMEEYRMRIESNPRGKLFETFLGTTFIAHPYRRTGAGWPSTIQNLRSKDAWAFFEQYYTPGNITMAVVGDVNPAEARRLAERYFTALPSRPMPPPVRIAEPKQAGAKQAQVESPAQPFLMMGYKRPDQYDKDDPVFDVIAALLSSGRTGLLYKELVRDKQLALGVDAAGTFPDGRYPNVFVVFIVPNRGRTVEENQKAFDDLLDKFKSQQADAESLARVKTKMRAGVIRRLDSNAALASLLTTYHAAYGDWRKLFTGLDEVDKVTAADVQRVAKKYFLPESRTISYTVQGGAK